MGNEHPAPWHWEGLSPECSHAEEHENHGVCGEQAADALVDGNGVTAIFPMDGPGIWLGDGVAALVAAAPEMEALLREWRHDFSMKWVERLDTLLARLDGAK